MILPMKNENTSVSADISSVQGLVIQQLRNSERRLHELVNALLIGNSFLVAAFAVILGQQIGKVVPYTIATVGFLFCALLFLSINITWRIWKEEYTYVYCGQSEIPGLFIWLTLLFLPKNIYRIWLPLLFLIMWSILIAFAID